MFITKYKKIFISISAVLVLTSLSFLFIFGLRIGIDFKGGAITEVSYKDTRPDQMELNARLQDLNFGSILLQPVGENDYVVKSRELSEIEHATLLKTLSEDGKFSLTEKSFNSIGPSVGYELTKKAITAVSLVSLAIIFFIAFSFRKVSKPVSSWKYGLIAVVALLHDITIVTGIFVLISKFFGAEVDTLFVVALLTTLGLSVSDTIVIFDRIRENLKAEHASSSDSFEQIVGKSLSQSFVRSLMTSLTVILVLLCLFFFGPESTKYFALLLTAGMFFGTYSSIFLASPLLVVAEKMQAKK